MTLQNKQQQTEISHSKCLGGKFPILNVIFFYFYWVRGNCSWNFSLTFRGLSFYLTGKLSWTFRVFDTRIQTKAKWGN